MEKSFYYSVPWSDVSFLKDALAAMEVTYWIEQPTERLQLAPGEVAFVFPNLHVRVYSHIRELFKGHGLRYPE